jgi:hypothetical protein
LQEAVIGRTRHVPHRSVLEPRVKLH